MPSSKEADELQTALYARASQFSEGKVGGVVSIEEAKSSDRGGRGTGALVR